MQQRTLNVFHKRDQQMQVEEPPTKSYLPWVEKYRPNKIEDISFQEDVVGSLKGVIKTGSMPHLLFYGPPGTGKTSAVLALSKQLFGPDFWRKRVLELNASDDRGINIVRNKIKNFAEQMAAKNPNPYVSISNASEYICPGYKIIILDEADSITREAQDALRRIIEDFSSTTRFCIICNYITKISEPLSSRCVKYRFKGIPEEYQITRLRRISEAEGVQVDDASLRKLYEISGGDLRRSINLLQSTSILSSKSITQELLFDFLPDTYIEDVLYCIAQSRVEVLIQQQRQIIMDGYNIEQLLQQLTLRLIVDAKIPELYKARILEHAAISERQLKEGTSPDTVLLNFLAQSSKILAQ